MAIQSKNRAAALIARLETKTQELTRIIQGRDLANDPNMPPGSENKVHIADADLRLAVGEFKVLLQEIQRLTRTH